MGGVKVIKAWNAYPMNIDWTTILSSHHRKSMCRSLKNCTDTHDEILGHNNNRNLKDNVGNGLNSEQTSIRVSPKGSTKAGFMKTPCEVLYTMRTIVVKKNITQIARIKGLKEPSFCQRAGISLERHFVCDVLGKQLGRKGHTYQLTSAQL